MCSWTVVSYSKEDFEYWLQANGHDVYLLSEEEMGVIANDIGKALGRTEILDEVLNVVMEETIRNKLPEVEWYALLDRLIPGEYHKHTWVYSAREEAEKAEASIIKILGGRICKVLVKGFNPNAESPQLIKGYVLSPDEVEGKG